MVGSICSFVFSCLIFAAFQQIVHCNYINCYSCSVCGTTSSSWSQVSNSSSGTVYCFKYVYSFSVISYTNRGASSTCASGSDNIGGTYYCCLTDYCNRSVFPSGSFSLIFVMIILLGLFKLNKSIE